MQITIPDTAADFLRERADQAGFATVDDYVLSIVLPSKPAENSSPEKTVNERSFYDAALESGLIGKYDDYPPDLSTNPKYMEGFGE